MAGPLTAVERFFERLFERPAARLFQARLEPTQIQRSLERAMEAERTTKAHRAYVPSAFRVLVSASDLAALDGDRAALGLRLSEALRVYARAHGYVLLARPRVEIESSRTVRQGDIRVFVEPVAITPEGGGQPVGNGSATANPGSPATGHAPDLDAMSQATAVFAAPKANTPRAVLALRTPNRPVARVPVKPGTIRIGRSLDNDVVLADDRVSRHHGQISVRLGMLVYTDLGSTNGSFLNSSAVTEIALGPGDVLQLGSSTITIEPSS
jgi:hypothetical protein